MPFSGNLPAKGTKPWYDQFKTAWDNLVAFVNGLETQIEELSPGGAVAWVDVTGKPSEFPPSAHTHVIADITGLQADLDAKALEADLLEFVDIANASITGLSTDISAVEGDITALSTEVGTKATQTSVDALSQAQVTMAGNLDATFELATGANNAAAAAQSTADDALDAAAAAVQPTNLRLPILMTQAEFDAIAPVPGQVYMIAG